MSGSPAEPQVAVVSRHEAVWWGIRCFISVAAISCAVALVLGIATHPAEFAVKWSRLGWWREIGISLVLSFPVVALAGTVSGHEHFRFAAGDRRIWAGIALLFGLALPFAIVRLELFAAVCGGVSVFVWFHCVNRIVLAKSLVGQRVMTVIGLLLMFGCCAVCIQRKFSKLDELLAVCAYCSVLLGDALVMRRISKWAQEKCIEQRTYTFQFSLATMLVFCVAIGAYALTLAYIFPPRW